MTIRKLAAILAAFALIAAACGDDDDVAATTAATTAAPTTTAAPVTTTAAPVTTTAAPATTTTTEAPPPGIGSEENPIQVLFVPSVSAEEIIEGGELMARTLNETTGLFFNVSVPTSYASTVEEMCASPDNTMGFIPAQAYVLGNELCGIDVELKSLRFGYTEYWTQFIVPRDSDIQAIGDLAGKTWAYPDAGSTSGFLVPSGLLQSLGIETGDSFEAGGHSATARAIYNGEADFGTTFFSPQIDADRGVVWDGTAAGADVADPSSCVLDETGNIDCGGEFPRDARRNIRSEAPDVIQKVRIVTLSDPIPNDTLSFGPEFPDDTKQAILDALFDFAALVADGRDDGLEASAGELFEQAFDAYSWSGIAETTDADFDFIRGLIQALGITVGDLD